VIEAFPLNVEAPMKQRRLWTGACALAMLLLLPRSSSAGILEIIAEMSGPQMLGFPFECRLGLSKESGASFEFCHWFAPLVGPGPEKKLWLTLEGGPYFATGAGKTGDLYETGDVYMLTFDPMIERVSFGDVKKGIYHGAGLTTNFLVGHKFRRFGNVGFKFRPVGFVIPTGGTTSLDFSFHLRFYPSRFTAEDFDVTAPSEEGVEWVRSVVVSFRF
jgi:hypothetical protein